jgi:hypothetical protein
MMNTEIIPNSVYMWEEERKPSSHEKKSKMKSKVISFWTSSLNI